MRSIGRLVGKVCFIAARPILLPIEVISPRLYMRVYIPLLRALGVRFHGMPRYISRRVRFDDFDLLEFGDRLVVSEGVVFLTHDYAITTALVAIGDAPDSDVAVNRGIVVGSNVFIGLGTIVLPGTEIGDNVVIGAGSVVRGRVESDSVIVGNPAVRVSSLTDVAHRWKGRLGGESVRVDFS